jgi:Tfp pilus assembly protein PilX
MDHPRTAARGMRRRADAGIALPMALIVLVVLTALAVAVLAVGSSETNIATNHVRTAQALALAEAGLESAFTTINTSIATMMASATPTFQTLAVTMPATGSTLASYGTYAVQYRKTGSNTVEVASTGTTSVGGAARVLRAIMTSNLNSITAVLSKHDITISGTTTVTGKCGSVHADDDLTLTGTAVLVAENATASDNYSNSGDPTIGGVAGGGRPQRVVPAIVPSTFLTQATAAAATDPNLAVYEFQQDGKVYKTGPGSSTRTLLTTVPDGSSYVGWTFSAEHGAVPSTWTATGTGGSPPGTTPPDKAVFYVTGDAAIGANIGTSTTPWTTTIVAATYGSPAKGGNLTVNAGTSPYLDAALNDLVLVAGANVNFAGNPTIQSGVIAAHGNIDVGGNVTITGALIAEGDTNLHGTVSISYDCGMNSGIMTAISVIAWGY